MSTCRITVAGVLLLIMAIPGGFAQMAQMGDADIANAVEDELLFDRGVPSNRIDVQSVNGVVMLKGTVNNILAKERAARIAKTVKGVRSVSNEIMVKPAWDLTDEQIKTSIEAALITDPVTESWEVVVAVSDGAATLTGTVDSWQEKEMAGQVAKGVKGVVSVNNDIEVDFQTDRPDTEIKSDIESALRNDVRVDDGLIDVQVTDGNVQLSGIVGSVAEKSQAYADAWVSGVLSIDDSGLNVERWARDEELRGDKYADRTDEETEDAIEDAMLYDPRVLSFKITPTVDMGIATLRGTVNNLKAKKTAAEIARNTVGVISVRNRIKVRGERPTDSDMTEKIRASIQKDPYLDRYDINTSVTDGIAVLTGTVDSYFEKGRAEDLASEVKGVEEVVNNLDVSYYRYPLAYDPYVYDYYPYDYTWYDYTPYYTYRTDADIKDLIETQFFWSPFVDGGDINIAVDDGEVTLTGNVDTQFEKQSATENAYEGGATLVHNELAVLNLY